jgi:hypothetical protein
MPCTRPAALSTVTTVTPVANWPRARRKSSEVSGAEDMGFSEDITGEERTAKPDSSVNGRKKTGAVHASRSRLAVQGFSRLLT